MKIRISSEFNGKKRESTFKGTDVLLVLIIVACLVFVVADLATSEPWNPMPDAPLEYVMTAPYPEDMLAHSPLPDPVNLRELERSLREHAYYSPSHIDTIMGELRAYEVIKPRERLDRTRFTESTYPLGPFGLDDPTLP